MRALQVAVLLAAVGTACAVGQATLAPPGGLPPAITPQFVLFTHDDAIIDTTFDMLHEVTDGRLANGCPLTATLFTQVQGTDCGLLSKLWNSGFEVADHTKNHEHMSKMGLKDVREEILGGRQGLADCGIPIQSIVGFRAPYLETKPDIRMVLKNNGYLYDSTLIEEGSGKSLTRGMGSRVWPWDMTNGIPIACGWFDNIQQCSKDEKYPGLWQVPVWNLNALGGPYTMDYGDDGDASVFDILKANFDAAYSGNRAPFPIFIHSPWLREGDRLGELKKFVDYARAKPHVYFVTVRQLISWLKNPVPAGQLTPLKLGCRNPGGAPATPQQLAAATAKPPPPKSPPPPTPQAKSPPPPVVVVQTPVPVPVVVPPVIPPVDPDTQPLPVDPVPVDPVPVTPTTTPDPVITPEPSPSPSPATMPPSGIRITMTLGGGSEDTFRKITEPQLLSVLRQVLAEASDSPAFIVSLVASPAGASGAPARRRRALQDGQQLLQAVAVVGGSQPLQMYRTMQSALRDGRIGTVLALSGAYLAAPPTIVPFQNGIDLPPPTTASPAPAASTPKPASPAPTPVPVPSPVPASADSSSSGSSSGGGGGTSLGAILGAAIGCAAAVILAAGLVYWFVWRPRQRRTAVADTAGAPSGTKAHSASDTSSQDSAPEPCAYVETGAAPYPTTNLASNALYEEQA